jgi:hypothetical protein
MRSIARENPLVTDALASLTGTQPVDLLSADAMAAVRRAKCAPIVRKNDERQLVYGVVYAPGEIDAHGEIMPAHAIEEMAHKFLRLMTLKNDAVIDQQHDNLPVAAYPVESYIETSEDMPWPAGSWIMGVKVEDAVIWAKIKAGEINGYSFEAMVTKMPMVVEVEAMPDLMAKTAMSEGHDHLYFMEFDPYGKVTGGITSYDAGHRHKISMGTATDRSATAGVKGHSHRLPV